MEFWGVELKGDKPVKVTPDDSQVVHISQATLAESKKGSDPVTIYAKIGTQKLAIGILSADNFPQASFDLVFEKEFELSHNSKNGNVHLTGYKSLMPDDTEDDEGFSDYSEDDMPLSLENAQNGVVAAPAVPKAKPAAPVAKKDNKPKEESEDESDDESDEDESGDDDSSDEDMAGSDSEGDSDDESDEEEETPVKSFGGKKRPNSATKTPEAKKAKIVTPQKSDGKKSVGGHIATPHPAKKDAKSPKSGGTATCGPCKKTFNSQGALDSHTKAKHSAK